MTVRLQGPCSPGGRAAVALVASALTVGAAGCAQCRSPERRSAAAAGSAASAVPASSVALPPVSTEALWVAARGADPLDLARLADALPTEELVEAARDNGKNPMDQFAALRALAFVTDLAPALPLLTELLAAGEVERSTLALQVLAANGMRRRSVEVADAEARRRCAEALDRFLAVAQDRTRKELAARARLAFDDVRADAPDGGSAGDAAPL